MGDISRNIILAFTLKPALADIVPLSEPKAVLVDIAPLSEPEAVSAEGVRGDSNRFRDWLSVIG